MSQPNLLEAFDLLTHAAQIRERLASSAAEVEKRRAMAREARWLREAEETLGEAVKEHAPLLERALALAQLSPARVERAQALQIQWVEALEKLQAGITFHASSRAPVLEALFPGKQKLLALRRAEPGAIEKYSEALEKRLTASYVKRMFAQEPFAFAPPVVEEIRAAFARWQAAVAEPVPPADAGELSQALLAAASRSERLLGQAKLLAAAALIPLEGAYESSGIGAKPRRRVREKPEAPAAPEQAPAPEQQPKAKGRRRRQGETEVEIR